MVFSVIFEVHPKPAHWSTYLSVAKTLRPISESVIGYIDNVRYRSLTREGWILSLSSWANEKALIRWRTMSKHHEAQEMGRSKLLEDYHLRVGQNMMDTKSGIGGMEGEERSDETEVGEAKMVVFVDAVKEPEWVKAQKPEEIANLLGLSGDESDLFAWDVFDNVMEPGHIILLSSWKAAKAAQYFEHVAKTKEGSRLRRVRVLRDYGMFDRREAPQYYPDAEGGPTKHF